MASTMKRALGILVGLCLLLSKVESRSYSPDTYPNPSKPGGAAACGRSVKRSFVCDPDGMISSEAADTVEGIIKDIGRAAPPYGRDNCPLHSTDLPGFQVAVALMDRMHPLADTATETARLFATRLFELWGVGDAECHNGVLLLLSREDRQVYIRRGSETLEAASDAKLSAVIDAMRPLLREQNYGRAIEQGVIDLGLVLAGGDLRRPWTDGPWLHILAWTGGGGLILSLLAWGSRNDRRNKEKCQALLDKLRAEQTYARTHRTYPGKSCPICFEDFEDTQPSAPPLEPARPASPADENSTVSNPLLPHGDTDRRADASDEGPSSSRQASPEAGQRLILPCGHVFCDPCISEWLQKNAVCPICRASADRGRGNEGRSKDPDAPSGSGTTQDLDADMYAMEIGYRMDRLHRWYPNWVTWDIVQQSRAACERGDIIDWNSVRAEQISASSHDRHQSDGHSGASTGFGGGTSSGGGGVGGSW